MTKTFLKFLITFILLGTVWQIIKINTRLYYSNSANYDDLLLQINYLKAERNDGAAKKMQSIYPEGEVFFESLYALSCIEYVERTKEVSINPIITKEINSAVENLFTPDVRSSFQTQIDLQNGAFYMGWSNFVLGKKVGLKSVSNESDRNDFKANCERIKDEIIRSESPFLESYRNQYWPADMMACIASLALHDKYFEPKYESLITDWVANVKLKLDLNGLIPHSVNSNGKVIEGARGSSQSLILSFLPLIDTDFAAQQYSIFKKLFVIKRLGLNAISEYPKNAEGNGDVDSGPIIFGVGASATLVAQRAAVANNDPTLALQLRNGIEAFGSPSTNEKSKHYLWGYFPIGDAFISWSRSNQTKAAALGNNWRLEFHIWSLLFVLFLLLLMAIIWRKLILLARQVPNKTIIN